MSGEYEQMELDVRLDGERDLKDNVSRIIQFNYSKRKMDAEVSGNLIPAVRNKHEGYGIAAEAWSKIQVKEKDIKNGMGDYLALLQVRVPRVWPGTAVLLPTCQGHTARPL